jgi:hypothetical protein
VKVLWVLDMGLLSQLEWTSVIPRGGRVGVRNRSQLIPQLSSEVFFIKVLSS